MRKLLSALALSATVACGGDSGTGPSGNNYEQIANTWVGQLGGISQGVAIAGDFTITISQSGGSLSGTWAMDGGLSDGVDAVAIAGSGTIIGSVAAGSNPSVNLTIRSGACPGRQMDFSGTYDSPNSRLTLVGSVDIWYSDCTLFLKYPMTMVLQS